MKLLPTFNIQFFSSYYISVLLSYFFLRLPIFKELLTQISTWLLSLLANFNFNVIGNGPIWLVFFVSSILLTSAIQMFIVIPLGFYINKDIGFNSNIEKITLFVLIFGSQIYLLNEIFRQPMPSEWLPQWIIKAFGGEFNTYRIAKSSGFSENAWAAMQYIWYLGPTLFLFFFNTKSAKPSSTAAESAKKNLTNVNIQH